MLHDHNLQRLYTLHNKNLGFCAKIDPRGPYPNSGGSDGGPNLSTKDHDQLVIGRILDVGTIEDMVGIGATWINTGPKDLCGEDHKEQKLLEWKITQAV